MFKGMICFADRRVIPWLMAVFFFLGLIIPCNALSTTSAIPQVLSKKVTEPDTATRARLMESYSRLPLSFEANHGQTDGKVKFLSRGSGYNLFLASTEAVLSLRKAQPPKARIKDKAGKEPALHKADKPKPATVVSMKLVGANPDPKITGVSQLPGKVNYFLGKDPKKWRTNIPTYARVRYTNVYPGIDLVFYGRGQKLEYDFIVAPGADPETIALCFGQTPLKIDQNGDLALDTKGGELRLQKPLIYQDIDGTRKPVPGGYVLHPVKNEKQTHRVGFKVAAYDRTRPLVIDPVLVYSTYLGGSSDDLGRGIAVDATGNCYVTGYTWSTDFPTQDPLYPDNAGMRDVFISRLSPAGDALVYSTYLGGSSVDYGLGIAVDATGNCYVTGWTRSTDFPTQDPLYPDNAGGGDAFVTKIGEALAEGPDLTGSWSSLNKKWFRGRCLLRGNFVVENQGNATAGDSILKFYLSEDDILDEGDMDLKEVAVGELDAGQSQNKRFFALLPKGLDPAGRYVIAVVDATDAVTETNENNNQIPEQVH